MYMRGLAFAVVSLLAVSLIYSSAYAFAAPRDPRMGSTPPTAYCVFVLEADPRFEICSWQGNGPGEIPGKQYSQTCREDKNGEYTDCDPVQ